MHATRRRRSVELHLPTSEQPWTVAQRLHGAPDLERAKNAVCGGIRDHAGHDAAGQVHEERVIGQGLQAEDPRFPGHGGVDRQPHLGGHEEDSSAVRRESTERAPECGVDIELTEEDTEADQPRHTRDGRLRRAGVHRTRVGNLDK
ncbi:hypothetical protein WME90_01385 [Sorangium sp. So ce375]